MKRSTMMVFLMVCLIFHVFSLFDFAYAGEAGTFSPLQVIENESLTSPLPDIRGWADDDYFFEYRDGKLYRVAAASGQARMILDSAQSGDLAQHHFDPMRAADHSTDFNTFLFLEEKTMFLFSREENRLVRVAEAPGVPQNPTLSPDGSKIAFTFKGNLYATDIASGTTTKLTEDGNDIILNGYASWVYYEEILGRQSRYRAFWWSPDSKRLAFMRFDQTEVPVFPIYRAEGIYGSLENMRYPKPGFPNPVARIGIAFTGHDKKNHEEKDHDKKDRIRWVADSGADYVAFPVWSKDGDALWYQWMNRDQDHLRVMRYDCASGRDKTVYEEKQAAWVEFFEGGDFHLTARGGLLFRSSRDGWFHLYYLDPKGVERRITGGQWSVNSIRCVDERGKRIYFSAAREDSTDIDYYCINFKGTGLKRLTGFKGVHRVVASPTGKYFIDTFSDLNTPEKMELRNKRGKLVRALGDSASPKLGKYHMARGKLFRINTDDGHGLPVIWYLPPGAEKNTGKKYPVVMYVYGGPGATIVRNNYSEGYRRGPTRFFLAQEGIIALFVDHRGSSHFGKKGMVNMHRKFGKWELNDYIQVVKYLRSLPFVDHQKIGIIGHSYGGYVAAMALTYGSDYFQYGISGSPVIDWRLYDSVYTERYMDTPQQNPEGYTESSVLTHIDKFKGVLRMTHGTMDDNVHAQNTIQFIDRLLDTGKTAELMLYPGDRHGIRSRKAREYRRSNLNFWLKHLLGKPLPPEIH